MYAVLVKVRIDPSRHAEAVNGLRAGFVPQVKNSPGFVRGTWFDDREIGYGMTVFESEDQARQMASTVASAPDNPVQVEEVHVYEVVAEA